MPKKSTTNDNDGQEGPGLSSTLQKTKRRNTEILDRVKTFLTTGKGYVSQRRDELKRKEFGKGYENEMEGVSVSKPTIQSFGQAFKKARLEGLDSFLFQGKEFSTATAEDVKKSGSTSLREYLNKRLASESED